VEEQPKSPYREEKPLRDIIPPDRRREKTMLIVVGSMVAGVALFLGGSRALDALKRPPVDDTPPTANDKRFTPTTLEGPDGPMRVPPFSKAVVHVWLMGCADCMPAFEAMRTLEQQGGLRVGVPEINVAYGQADPAWAARYGVRRNLVYDRGGTVLVRPLGISTFTTLVVDENGVVLHRDRPDRPGYAERIRAIVGALSEGSHTEPDVGGEFGPDVVRRTVSAHSAEIRKACWDARGDSPDTAKVSVVVEVAVDGSVSSAMATGDDPKLARCLETHIKSWTFPPPKQTSTVNIPFNFVRQ
jgi:hypothetical protein